MFLKLCKNIKCWKSAQSNCREATIFHNKTIEDRNKYKEQTLPMHLISGCLKKHHFMLSTYPKTYGVKYYFSSSSQKPSQPEKDCHTKPSIASTNNQQKEQQKQQEAQKAKEKEKQEQEEEMKKRIMQKIKIIADHEKQKELLQLLQKQIKKIETKKERKLDAAEAIVTERVNWVVFFLQKFGTFGSTVLASLVFTLFLMNWLIEHPTVYEELVSNLKVYDEELENQFAINNLLEKLKANHDLWHNQHEFLKIIDKEVAKATEIQFPTKFYPQNKRMKIIESCTHSYLPQCFLLDFFELESFPQLLENEQLFYVELKRTTQFQGRNDPLRKLKILTNHIYKKIQPVEKAAFIPFKSTIFSSLDIKPDEDEDKRHKKEDEPKKILLIIDNFQELAEQMENDDTRASAIVLFNKLKYISKSKYVNIVGIGYNSVFTDTILESVSVKPHEIKTSTVYLKEDKFRSIVNKILTDHKKELIDYLCYESDNPSLSKLNFDNIINQIGTNTTTMESFVKLLKFLQKSLPKHVETKGKEQKSMDEQAKDLINQYFWSQTNNRKEKLFNEVFKGSKKERQTKIRLLSKMLLDSYNLKDWDDRDLIALKLDEKEFQTYQQLCKEHILFYFNFYYEEYKSIYYRILKRKQYLYELYQEEEKKLKQQQQQHK